MTFVIRRAWNQQRKLGLTGHALIGCVPRAARNRLLNLRFAGYRSCFMGAKARRASTWSTTRNVPVPNVLHIDLEAEVSSGLVATRRRCSVPRCGSRNAREAHLVRRKTQRTFDAGSKRCSIPNRKLPKKNSLGEQPSSRAKARWHCEYDPKPARSAERAKFSSPASI